MKKLFSLIILSLLVVSFSMVSAETFISGQTFMHGSSPIVPVVNASVEVNCTHLSNNITSTETIFSDEYDGTFLVSFPTAKCNENDFLIVTAVKGDLHGSESGIVHDGSHLMTSMDWGFVGVPMVPEFGFFVGMLIILSAVIVFFVVRKE